MIAYTPSRIAVEKDARHFELTRKILKCFPGIPKSLIKSASSSTIDTSNTTLILAKHRGEIIVPCPGTPAYLCCNYYIIDTGTGCIFNCSYCFLHQYRNTGGIIQYVNLESVLKRLTGLIRNKQMPFKRVGTGEFTDSLMLDPITGYSKKLISFFSDKHIALELKTKSTHINNLLGLKHNKRTVVAWSLNPAEIINREESASAGLEERLESAQLCQKNGYPLAFHFDPIIYSSRWETQYKKVIDTMRHMIDPDSIVWISMGTLRFHPGLKPIMQKRFPKSTILYEEMVKGLDGKMRYLQPVRIEIYKKMHQWLKSFCKHTPIYLCMESPIIWQRSLGFCPENPKNLESFIMSRWEQLL